MPQNQLIFQIFSYLFMLALLISKSLSMIFLVGIDWKYIIIAVIGSACGAFVLGYFRPTINFWEKQAKMVASAISGLFIGAFLTKYFDIENWEYIGFAYFISGLLSLIILKALINLTENNIKDVFQSMMQKAINMQSPIEHRKKNNNNHRKEIEVTKTLEVKEVNTINDIEPK